MIVGFYDIKYTNLTHTVLHRNVISPLYYYDFPFSIHTFTNKFKTNGTLCILIYSPASDNPKFNAFFQPHNSCIISLFFRLSAKFMQEVKYSE